MVHHIIPAFSVDGIRSGVGLDALFEKVNFYEQE
jgi:hypothetical protein